jgi:hypothetical protein
MKVTGALAWNAEVNMSPAEVDDFLSGRWVARVATLGADGYPIVVPLWYYWDGRCLYFNLATSRVSYRNLRRDARCSAVIDMDDRPLAGFRHNLARAVIIVGDVEMSLAGSGQKVSIEAGPFAGDYLPEEALRFITRRYSLSERDGAVGFTTEAFSALLASDEARQSQLFKEDEGRVLVKLSPKKIRAWDFSKAPIGYST